MSNLDTNPGLTSNKPTYYLLDYGDIKVLMYALWENVGEQGTYLWFHFAHDLTDLLGV